MPNRIIPGQIFYTGGTGIEIDNDKVISLKLRDENNLIFVNENNEVYVDLQLPDGIEPTDAFPVGVTTGRVLVGDGRDKTGTIISAKTTSGDEIKVLYADDGTLRLDNGTGTFKQVYFKADVDAIVQAIWNYIYANCNTKTFYTGTYDVNLAQAVYDWISQGNFGIVYFNPVQGIKRDVIFPPTTTETGTISSWSYTDVRQATGGMFYEDLITLEFGVSDGVATTGINSNGTVVHNDGRIILSDSVAPSNPIVGTTWYDTTSDSMKVYDGTAWQSVGGGDVLVSDQANNIFTPGMKIWGGTESDYQSLTPDSNTAYLLLADQPSPGWQPGVNTVGYRPFNGDVDDYSSYHRAMTVLGNTSATGTPVFDTLASGKKVANFIKGNDQTESNWVAYTDNITDLPSSGNMTLSFWMNWSGFGGDTWYQEMVSWRSNANYGFKRMTMTKDSTGEFLFHGTGQVPSGEILTIGTWYNFVCVVDNGTCNIYMNGNTTPVYSSSYSYGTGSPDVLNFGMVYSNNSNKREETYNGKLSEVIIENVAWTAQEVADYYNLTKGDYGIS